MLDALGRALPRVTPPADLFQRVQAKISAPEVGAEAPASAPRVRRRLVRRPWILAGGLAAATTAVVLVLTLDSPAGAPTATAAVVSHLAGVHVSGTASLYRGGATTGTLRLRLRAVPAPPGGHHYEVWVLARGETTMAAVGSFTPTGDTVELRLPLPESGAYDAVDISVQQNGGPAAHSNVSLAGGTFRR